MRTVHVGVTLKPPFNALAAAGANQLKPTDAGQLADTSSRPRDSVRELDGSCQDCYDLF